MYVMSPEIQEYLDIENKRDSLVIKRYVPQMFLSAKQLKFLGGETMDPRCIMQQRIKEKSELLTKEYTKDYAYWCNLRLRIQRIESKSHPSSRMILQKIKKESYVLGAHIYQKYYRYLPLIRQVECDSLIGDSIFTRTVSNHIFK